MRYDHEWAEAVEQFLDDMGYTAVGKRGKNYARQGKVVQIDMDDDGAVIGLVQGGRVMPYRTTLRLATDPAGYLETACTCPMMKDCKHAVALALALMYEACEHGSSQAQVTNEVVDGSWRKGRRHTSPRLSAKASELFEDAAHGKRTVKRREPPWWRDLLEGTSREEKRQALVRGIRARLSNIQWSWYFDGCIGGLLEIENPIEMLRAFDPSIERVSGVYSHIGLNKRDAELAAFLESEEARALDEAAIVRIAEARLFQWVESEQAARWADNAYVDLVWIPQPHRGGLATLCFELSLTTKRLRRSPRNRASIAHLLREIQGGQRQLSPAETRLVKWIATRPEVEGVTTTYVEYARVEQMRNETLLPVVDAMTWLNHWGTQGLIRWQDGGPVRFHPVAATLMLASHSATEAAWTVRLPAEGGGETRTALLCESNVLSDSVLKTGYHPTRSDDEPTVFVREGDLLYRLETSGMPVTVLAGAYHLPRLPLERLRKTPKGIALAKRYARGRLSNEPDVLIDEEVAVEPVVESRYDEDRGRISMVVRARSEQDVEFIRTHRGEWEQLAAGSTNTAEESTLTRFETDEPTQGEAASPQRDKTPANGVQAIVQSPRREDVAPLEEWLVQVMPPTAELETTETGLSAFEWRVVGTHLERLVHYWPGRPRGVVYLGNRPFQNLVTPRRVNPIKVSVKSSGVNWLEVSVDMEQEMDRLSMQEVTAALEEREGELVLLPGGRLYRRGDLESYRKQLNMLEDMGVYAESGTQRLHALQLTGISDTALEDIGAADARFAELADQASRLAASFRGVPHVDVPGATSGFLRPYQQQGVDFIVWAAQTFGGAILADDMGLGKTLEILAALLTLRAAHANPGPSLVVCPASVAHNWLREAERFAPELKTVVVERGVGRRTILDRLDEYDLVVKNYALTRRDADVLSDRQWFMICVDEAQAIKNPDAQITKTVKALSAEYKFALTGTPIENRLTDLWSITDFAVPGYLQSLQRFEERIKTEDPQRMYRTLRARLRPVLIRRVKSDVAPELPPRIEERRDCHMVASQRKAYLSEVMKARSLLEATDDDRVVGKQRIIMLAALTRLRQICCDPALVGLPDKGSGKVEELMGLVTSLAEAGHKILLFSQFVRMIERLQPMINKAGVPTRVLTGKTQKRQPLIDEFEADPTPSVFLISLKAGGQGLNLVSASHVILFDPWWNPAVEAQAIDRTHRIGQNKTVVAFRLVTENTIEERIIELQDRKRAMINNVLEEGSFNRSLTKEDFAYLLGE